MVRVCGEERAGRPVLWKAKVASCGPQSPGLWPSAWLGGRGRGAAAPPGGQPGY